MAATDAAADAATAADADAVADAKLMQLLVAHGERINNAKSGSADPADFEAIINAVSSESVNAKLRAAEYIPRLYQKVPSLAPRAMSAMFDLAKMREIEVRLKAIQGFRQFFNQPGFVSEAAALLGRRLTCVEEAEKDAVCLVLIALVRKDVKNSLEPLFKLIQNGSEITKKIISFLTTEVFPLKATLLRPQAEMETYMTGLIKKSVQGVPFPEFKQFLDFLKSFSRFGVSASKDSLQELLQVIQVKADLNEHFNVSDIGYINNWSSCMELALPIFMRGASSSKFLDYFINQIVPAFDKIPEEKKLDLLKIMAASSPYAAQEDSRQLLPYVVDLLQSYMPRDKENINHNYVECLLYTFHHLGHKTPNTTNRLCGYKIATGKRSDIIGEDFSEHYKDFTERLSGAERIVKKLTQGMPGSANEGDSLCYKNILAMTQPLLLESPVFFGGDEIRLSCPPKILAAMAAELDKIPAAMAAELDKIPAAMTAGRKRPQSETLPANKKGRGGNETGWGTGGRGRGAWHGWR